MRGCETQQNADKNQGTPQMQFWDQCSEQKNILTATTIDILLTNDDGMGEMATCCGMRPNPPPTDTRFLLLPHAATVGACTATEQPADDPSLTRMAPGANQGQQMGRQHVYIHHQWGVPVWFPLSATK